MNQRRSLKELNLLNEVLIVMITPFDLFGYGLYRYTFQMKCRDHAKVSGFKKCIDVFVRSKQVKRQR